MGSIPSLAVVGSSPTAQESLLGQAKSRASASCDDSRRRRACTCSTEALLEKYDMPQTSIDGARQPPCQMGKSEGSFPYALQVDASGRRALHQIQGSSSILGRWYEILASILRLRNEATTCSSPCRWRSVWRISPSDISTATAPSPTWTSSDELSLDQQDEIDVGQSYGERKGVSGRMRSYHHEVSCCRCLYLCSCLMIDWARAIVLRNHNNIDA